MRRARGVINGLGGRRFWDLLVLLMVCAATFPASGRAAAAPARVTETAGATRLASRGGVQFSAAPPTGLPIIDVDGTATFQTITGFGAALTDRSAWLIHDRL
ncbi:MAG TPA: hypothetical protein VGI50_12040, partial [Solirubrobacteraceae bacterium]